MSRLLTALSCVAAVCATDAPLPESLVETPLGPILGVVNPMGRVFMGVPYAMPPVQQLRWQSPQPIVAWGPTVYQGIYEPAGCMQACHEPPHICPPHMSEDCLYLNVWTPRLASLQAPAPVQIFFHGGNFRDGYAGGEVGILYNGTEYTNATGHILVVANYRLGALGFLYTGDSILGNYGLQDQELVMRWVQQNIASFGGDPTRVTISGQSAGAMSVASHLSRPETQGLYSAAIMHSEPFALPFRDHDAGIDLATVYAQNANCTKDLIVLDWAPVEACLRNLSSLSLLTAQNMTLNDPFADLYSLMQIFVPFPPTYQTDYLPQSPLDAFQAGQVNDVPIIIGNTLNEGNLFINGAFTEPVNETKFTDILNLLLGSDTATKVLQQYPIPSPPPADFRPLLFNISTDGIFICPTRNITTVLAQASNRNSDIFLYIYKHILSYGAAAWGPEYPFNQCVDAVCHGADLPIWFHPDYPQYGTNYTADETVLTRTMEWYWANFGTSGNPGEGYPDEPLAWPAYSRENRSTMIFDTPANQIVNSWSGPICDFWDTVGYHFY